MILKATENHLWTLHSVAFYRELIVVGSYMPVMIISLILSRVNPNMG